MTMEIRATLVIWICILSQRYYPCSGDFTGVDIGNSCTYDSECNAGNGGEYSKCNQDLNICICTINHLGEDKCLYDRDRYDHVCRQQKLYTKRGYCTLECSPIGTIKWQEGQDWYGNILEPFALIIHDKKTSVCYDPLRALNSVPDGLEIKQSTIPNAGLGAFTNRFIQRDTIFGPYKGVFVSDTYKALESGYSWKMDPQEGRDDTVWVDGKDVTLSNWLRYINAPITAEMENLVSIEYKGETFYQVFKSIQPGTELLISYGVYYSNSLGIKPFEQPSYYYAKSGYAGGTCREDEEGQPCLHDANTICAYETCFCVPGTHIRAGMCLYDETLGGICAGPDGGTCKHDINTECQRGVCVCKNNPSPACGRFDAPDETFGGRCNGTNGQTCLLDKNAECVHGLCDCKYGTAGIGRKCLKDGVLHGMCREGKCLGLHTVCDSTSNTCICKATHFPKARRCVRK